MDRTGVSIRLALEDWEGLRGITEDQWTVLQYLLREACGDKGGILLQAVHNERDVYLHVGLKLEASVRGILDSIAVHLNDRTWSAQVDISRFRWSGEFYALSVGLQVAIPDPLEHPWDRAHRERREHLAQREISPVLSPKAEG
jgi:hypothetical protein